jgi:hypothetical protein
VNCRSILWSSGIAPSEKVNNGRWGEVKRRSLRLLYPPARTEMFAPELSLFSSIIAGVSESCFSALN